jgi:hypothetical protein
MVQAALLALNASGVEIGLFAPGAVGSFFANLAAFAIDAKLIYPAIFPVEPVEGNRFNNLEIQRTEEGSPANRLFGRAIRVAGTVIWQTRWREVRDSQHSSKGGSGGEFVEFKYYSHAAIEICRTKRGKGIKGIKEVYADGKLFYKQNADFNITASVVSASASDAEVEIFNSGTGQSVTFRGMTLRSSDNSLMDLSKLQSGKNATISGFTDGVHPLQGKLKVNGTQAQIPTDFPTGVLVIPSRSAGSTNMVVESTGSVPFGTLYVGDTFTINGVAGTYTVLRSDRTWSVAAELHVVTFTPGLASTAAADAVIVPVGHGSGNNGTYQCVSSMLDEPNNASTATFRVTSSLVTPTFAGKGAGDSVTIFQEQPQFSKTQVADVRFYNGTRDQIADPLIVEIEQSGLGGAANVPAHRNKAYMVVEDLEGTDFGNRIPNFEFVVEVGDDDTMATALSEIMLDAGLATADFDVSGVTGTLGGFAIRGALELKSALQPILLTNKLLAQQNAGVIKFFQRGAASNITITGLTGAHEPDSTDSGLLKITDAGDVKAVQEVIVRYYDSDNGYQVGAKRARLTDEISADVREIDTQMVMTGNQAQQLAETMLAQSNLSRVSATWTLSPSFINQIQESMRATFVGYGRTWDFLTTRVEVGNNYLVQCEGVWEDLSILTQTTLGEGAIPFTGEGETQPRAVTWAPSIVGQMMDLPPLQDEQVNQPGFYVAGSSSDMRAPWRGFSLYESPEPDSNFRLIERFAQEAVMGVVTYLPSLTVTHYNIDYASTLRVQLLKGFTLESVTEDELLAGKNRFLIGDEIIGAANCTAIAEDSVTGQITYELTTLLRGLKDTFTEIANHIPYERFVWLDGPGIYFVPHSVNRINESFYYKLVAGGGQIQDARDRLFTSTGRCCKPFRPVNITGSRNESNDLTITWERQTRRSIQFLDHNTAHDEEEVKYKVRILLTPGASVAVREIITTSNTTTYNATQQSTDGIVPGNPVTVEIVQVSKFVQDGMASEETL